MKYKFRSKPFKHQRRGLVRLWKQGGGALFWEPGTGKTKTALDFAAALSQAGKVWKVLVLCPINAMQVWPDQIEKHFPVELNPAIIIPEGKVIEKAEQIHRAAGNFHKVVFVILNYEATIKRDNDWPMMKALEEYDPELLILDESQKVKNATAKRSKAAHRLGRVSRYRVLLSGTPVSKNYLDLYSQLKVLDERIWTDPQKGDVMSWTRFRSRYGIYGGRSGYELRGYQNVDDLQRRYKPYITTARKRDCLDLPPVTDEVIPVEMNAASRLAYDAFSEEGMVVWRRHLIDAPIVITKLLRLQEMTGGGVHDEVGEVVDFQYDKLEVLGGLLDELKDANQKVVIFARFRWELNAIAFRFGVTKVIRGGVSSNQRRDVVRGFIRAKDHDVLLIQVAAGEALDGLQTNCSYAIFYSTDFSWDNFTQARGRLDRSGQESPVTFYHLHMVNTVDKLVFKALQEKKNLEKMVMDDPDLLVVDRA
jgi:SNF2 family DNA or RNA helicase